MLEYSMEETRSDFKKSLAAMGFKRGKRPKGHVERERDRRTAEGT